MATKRVVKKPAASAKRPSSGARRSPSVRLTVAQKELLERIEEGVRTGDYGVLQTADPAVLQSLWDLKLIKIRTVPEIPGLDPERRKRIKEAVLAAKNRG